MRAHTHTHTVLPDTMHRSFWRFLSGGRISKGQSLWPWLRGAGAQRGHAAVLGLGTRRQTTARAVASPAHLSVWPRQASRLPEGTLANRTVTPLAKCSLLSPVERWVPDQFVPQSAAFRRRPARSLQAGRAVAARSLAEPPARRGICVRPRTPASLQPVMRRGQGCGSSSPTAGTERGAPRRSPSTRGSECQADP